MLHTAAAMFGPGFVWLVANCNPLPRGGSGASSGGSSGTVTLSVLNTYIAGSPYPAAHFRRQSEDVATAATDVRVGEWAGAYRERVRENDGVDRDRAPDLPPAATAYGTANVGHQRYGRDGKAFGPTGADLAPLLCVSTWEHVYMWDYGPWGKEKYLEQWWDRVDWNKVQERWVRVAGTAGRRVKLSAYPAFRGGVR